MSGVVKTPLFQVNEENLETGLRSYPVGYCVTSFVDPQKGLFYADKPLQEITSWTPEQVIFLLYHGREGSLPEIQEFASELKKRATLSPQLIEQIKQLPREGEAMKLFSTSILLLGMLEGKGDYREDALDCIAKIPLLAAHVINHHAGWGETPPLSPTLSYMENFASLLKIPHPTQPQLPEIFKLFDILHYDHGGGNLSIFVAKAVASGLEDLYGSVAAGMCALAGKRHGGANQECLFFVRELLDALGQNASPAQVEEFLRQKMGKNALIYGFGHAVLRVEDPRATIQYEIAKKYYPSHPLVKMALLIRSEGSKVLKENPKISCPYPNVDAISGTLLSAAGFPYPEYFPLLFGLSRAVGMAIQIVYERLEARNGKGTPIVRPKYPYKSLPR